MMNKPTQQPGPQQREALKQAEKRADRERPQNFKDEANEEKIVEVPPIDGDGTPIRGLDPDKR